VKFAEEEIIEVIKHSKREGGSESHGRRGRHFIAGGKIIVLLGSQVSPVRPSDKSSVLLRKRGE
jgi:hypothetical protein